MSDNWVQCLQSTSSTAVDLAMLMLESSSNASEAASRLVAIKATAEASKQVGAHTACTLSCWFWTLGLLLGITVLHGVVLPIDETRRLRIFLCRLLGAFLSLWHRRWDKLHRLCLTIQLLIGKVTVV